MSICGLRYFKIPNLCLFQRSAFFWVGKVTDNFIYNNNNVLNTTKSRWQICYKSRKDDVLNASLMLTVLLTSLHCISGESKLPYVFYYYPPNMHQINNIH